MSEDLDEGEVYFPPARISKIGNTVMITLETEDDAVVVYEMFHSLALGHAIAFRSANIE